MVHGTMGLLLAAVAGYWVLERAESHKGRLRNIGRLLGGLIIIVSLIGSACKIWYLATEKGGYCPVGKGPRGWQRPMSDETLPSSSMGR